jgi:hypothetical protein
MVLPGLMVASAVSEATGGVDADVVWGIPSPSADDFPGFREAGGPCRATARLATPHLTGLGGEGAFRSSLSRAGHLGYGDTKGGNGDWDVTEGCTMLRGYRAGCASGLVPAG